MGIYIYRRRHDIITLIREAKNDNGMLNSLITAISSCWLVHASIWHSYEVHGYSTITELQSKKKVLRARCMYMYTYECTYTTSVLIAVTLKECCDQGRRVFNCTRINLYIIW